MSRRKVAKKRKCRDPLARLKGESPQTAALYKAVRDYVEHHGGKLVVIGGIEVQKMPLDAYRFRVAVWCTGRMPQKPEAG